MRFQPTKIPGVSIIDIEAMSDERGSFARIFCQREFVEAWDQNGRAVRVINVGTIQRLSLCAGCTTNCRHMPNPRLFVRCAGGYLM